MESVGVAMGLLGQELLVQEEWEIPSLGVKAKAGKARKLPAFGERIQ